MTSVLTADEAIASFTEHPTPLAFLSVVQAMSDVPGAQKRLTSLWKAHRAQITPTANDVAEVLSWLSEIRPCGSFEMAHLPPPEPHKPQPKDLPEDLKKIIDFVAQVGPTIRAWREKHEKQLEEVVGQLLPHAGYFGAGYLSYYYFAQFFPEQNPVDVIGHHTRLWFTSNNASEAPRSTTQRTLDVRMCAYLHTVWLPSLGRMLDGRRDNTILRQLALWLQSDQALPLVVGRPEYFCTNRRPRPWQFDYQLIAKTLPLFSQSYFERVLESVSDHLDSGSGDIEDASYEHVFLLCDVLLSLPIGRTSPNVNTDLGDGALARLVESYELSDDNLPHVPVPQCRRMLECCVNQDFACSDYQFRTLCARISRVCNQQLASNGRLPYDWIGLAEECLTSLTYTSTFSDNLAATPLPLPLLLATTRHESKNVAMMLAMSDSQRTPLSWAYFLGEGVPFSQADSLYVLQAANVAANLHYWELANALFAFVVFRGLLDSKTALLCDWAQLIATYTRLAGTPGHDMAEKALTITHDALQELSPGSFHAYLLSQWSRSRNTHSMTHAVKWGEVEESLRDQLLQTVWPRLPLQVQNQVINAEALWTLQHRYLGTTDPPIGANLVVEYAKCIEVPLKERLGPVLDSQAFKEYQARQGKNSQDRPTLGTMVHLLLDRQLPLPLQGEMRKLRMAGIDVAGLQSIAPELKTIPHERNDGAHAHVTGAAAMKFRERLYGGGVFARFFSALYPA